MRALSNENLSAASEAVARDRLRCQSKSIRGTARDDPRLGDPSRVCGDGQMDQKFLWEPPDPPLKIPLGARTCADRPWPSDRGLRSGAPGTGHRSVEEPQRPLCKRPASEYNPGGSASCGVERGRG